MNWIKTTDAYPLPEDVSEGVDVLVMIRERYYAAIFWWYHFTEESGRKPSRAWRVEETELLQEERWGCAGSMGGYHFRDLYCGGGWVEARPDAEKDEPSHWAIITDPEK